VLFLHRTLLGGKSFPILQLDVVLQVFLVLASKPGWLVLFPLVLVEGELRLYQLIGGVGLACFLALVFPMVEADWRLCDWTVVLVVPLRVQFQSYYTLLPTWPLACLLFPAKHHSWLL
jgi:hypothetical protein